MRIERRLDIKPGWADPDIFIICLYIFGHFIRVYYSEGYFEIDIGNKKEHASYTIATEKAYVSMHEWGV